MDKALDVMKLLLENPSGMKVVMLVVIIAFLAHITPIAVLTWIQYDGNNRIVGELRELKQAVQVNQRIANKGS